MAAIRLEFFVGCCLLAGCRVVPHAITFLQEPGGHPVLPGDFALPVMGDNTCTTECAGEDPAGKPVASGNNRAAAGWPVHSLNKNAGCLPLTVVTQTKAPNRAGLWEWEVYAK